MTSSQSMKFRPVMIEDTDHIYRLICALAAHEKRPDAVTATPAMIERLLFGPAATAHGLVAVLDGHIVGYALMAIKFSSFRGQRLLYLEDIFIDPDVRGQGYGKAFMQAVAAFAQDNNCVSMEWSALDFNQEALRFYGKIGATREGGRIYFEGDEAFMQDLLESE